MVGENGGGPADRGGIGRVERCHAIGAEQLLGGRWHPGGPRDAAAQGRLRWWSSAGLIALAELAVDTGDERAARLLGEAAELAGRSGAHGVVRLAAEGRGASHRPAPGSWRGAG